MPVRINERQEDSVTVLELEGPLTVGRASDALNEKLQVLIGEGRLKILLDCSQVSAIDSQGISALVRGVVSIGKRGGRLKLLSPSPRVRYVLEITRLLKVIECFDDKGPALRSF